MSNRVGSQGRGLIKTFTWAVIPAAVLVTYWIVTRPPVPPMYDVVPACEGLLCLQDRDCGTKCTCQGAAGTEPGQCVGRRFSDLKTDSSAVWTLEEEFRVSGTPSTPFGVIVSAMLDETGRLYALDGQLQEVHVFDSAGGYSHRIGRKGEGPGELSSLPAGIALGPNRTVWVGDLGRISVFSRGGEFVESIQRRWQGSMGVSGDRPFGPAGVYIEWSLGWPQETDRSLGAIHHQLVALSADRQSLDTLMRLTEEPESFSREGRDLPLPFFGERLVKHIDRGMVWFAHTRTYKIYGVSLDGDTVVAFGRDDVVAAPIEERDLAIVREHLERFPTRFNDVYLRNLPPRKPIIHALFADGTGYVFVVPETETVSRGSVIDVFFEDGSFVTRMNVPETLRPNGLDRIVAYGNRTHLLWSGLDAAGAAFVSRLRLRRPGRRP